MKTQIKPTKPEKKFEPIEVTFTVETLDDAKLMYNLLNIPPPSLRKALKECLFSYKENTASIANVNVFRDFEKALRDQGIKL